MNYATRRKRMRGSYLIEASFALVLFLLIVFSLFDFGYALFLHQTLVNQVRLGARYGAINPGNLTAIRNMVLYGQPTGSGNGIVGLAPASVSVTRPGTPGGVDDRIVIAVSGYHFTFVTPGYAGSKTAKPITLTIPVEN